MTSVLKTEHFTATQNACNLCAPLGAALVFKGIANTLIEEKQKKNAVGYTYY